jgi:hypothetical protein
LRVVSQSAKRGGLDADLADWLGANPTALTAARIATYVSRS